MQRTLGVKGFEILGFALTVSHHSPTNGREASCKSHDHGAHFQTHSLSLVFTSFRTMLGPTKENQIVQEELVAGVPVMQTFTLDPTRARNPPGNSAFCQFPGRLASDNSKVTPNVAKGNYTEIVNRDSIGGRGVGNAGPLAFTLFQFAPLPNKGSLPGPCEKFLDSEASLE